jgi:hypothetical protein
LRRELVGASSYRVVVIDIRKQIIESVERELAALQAADSAIADGLSSRARRRTPAPSIVYSIRLSSDEFDALERRAAILDVKPSVLARNLVRVGLHSRGDEGLTAAMHRLEAAVEELRELVA